MKLYFRTHLPFLILTSLFYQNRSTCIPYNVTVSSLMESRELLTEGCSEFGFSLLQTLSNHINDGVGGILISPFGIWSALLIAYYGSAGSTRVELETILGIDKLNKLEIKEVYKDIIREHAGYTLANRMYLQRGLELNHCSLEQENVGYVDFENDPEGARLLINRWIEKRTRDKIKNVLPSSSVDSQTRLIIANAVYFHATWHVPFDPSKTRSRPFKVSLGEETLVEMMSITGRYPYAIDEDLQCSVLELPYGERRDVSLTIVLPDHLYFGLKVLEPVLTNGNIHKLRKKLRHRNMHVELPKFRMSPSYDLMNALKSIGLRQVFQRGQADFSDFFASDQNLAIDGVRHTAAIDVSEKGTTAAASTVFQFLSRSGQRARPLSFIVDRPFFFLILDKETDVTLFMGKVWRPMF